MACGADAVCVFFHDFLYEWRIIAEMMTRWMISELIIFKWFCRKLDAYSINEFTSSWKSQYFQCQNRSEERRWTRELFCEHQH